MLPVGQESHVTPRFDLDFEDDLIDSFIDLDDEEDMAELDAIVDGIDFVQPQSQLPEISPSEFTEFAIRVPIKGDLDRFDFTGREYLKEIYDTSARRILMKCGRQTEKSGCENEYLALHDGSTRPLKDIEVGDRVISLADDGSHTTVGTVTWKSRRYKKQCLRVKTKQNLQADVAMTHPMRVWGRWAEAGELRIGDRLATLRKGGVFTGTSVIPDDHVKFAAYMIGDGQCGPSINYTQMDGPCLYEFEELADQNGWPHRCERRVRESRTFCARLEARKGTEPRSLLEQWGLWGKRSSNKSFPAWVWGLDRRQSALFLNRLWSTDGSVKNPRRSQYEIIYCSISHQLVKDVQRLLWKFGIPSRVREYKPNLYKGSDRLAYILRIQTQQGAHDFLTAVGALGKSEEVPLPSVDPSSNRDTYPIEVNEDIRQIIESRGHSERRGRHATHSLRSVGLRETLKYPPSRQKLQDYVDFFRQDDRYAQGLVDRLAEHLDTDIYWDKIDTIEDLGEQWCYDISVDEGQSFVIDGLVTHNSTTLGNKSLAFCGINGNFNVLYVSATAQQAQVFSVDRIKNVIDTSPEFAHLVDRRLQQNVLFKQFKNRSNIRIRYAFLSADRVRGIPADKIVIDEIQDIITDNIPVIEACSFHSDWKIFSYSGTPKSLDNTIEVYWADFSTQNEWVVPCEACGGTDKNPSSWFWNILGARNIGKKGLVCAKCARPISARHPYAQWSARQPVTEGNRNRVTFEGYRIPQLMVPWVDWDEVLSTRERFSTAQFNNEVLGLSYDSGVRPLTRAQIESCCRENIHFKDVEENARRCYGGVFAGLDWGCHDDQTRILTDSGFKYFKDLTDDDLVAQFDKDTREMSLVKPDARTVRDWNEPLYHVTGRGVDMMLTGTHRMLFQNGDGWEVDHMRAFAKKPRAKVRGYVEWVGKELESFTLPGLPKSSGYSGSEDHEIDGDLWMELLGYLVSEAGLCYSNGRPSCVKMSQRAVDLDFSRVDKIRKCLDRSGLKYSEFPNEKTLDFNWTLYGKQLWHWWANNIGTFVDNIRVPREFLGASRRQLEILFNAMVFGDGSRDSREGNHNGAYYSTSKGLCEDFQEVCIRLGLKSKCGLHRKAEGNRKARYRVSWSGRRDLDLNAKAMNRIARVPYSGRVYCCKVPSGFIVTERNGCIAYQANTGENTYTVISLGGYMGGAFQIFFLHRFTGDDLDPRYQLDKIAKLLHAVNFKCCGADYGGGFDRNDWLMRNFGPHKFVKFQYAPNPSRKIYWQPKLGRYIAHRTEIMSDIFNALKRKQIWLPNWEEMVTPHGEDLLNVFSEWNNQLRMLQYKVSPGKTDDTFHSILYCMLASMIGGKMRPDILVPVKEGDVLLRS